MFKRRLILSISLLLIVMATFALAAESPAIPWTSEGVIPGLQVRYGALGAAWHEDALHIVSLTRDNTQHSWWQAGRWTGPTTAAGLHCGLVPVIASDGHTLHLLTEISGKKIGYSRWDGRAWSNTEPIDGLGTNKALEMAIGDGTIHLVHCGKNSDAKRLWHASQSGWGWSGRGPCIRSTSALPARPCGTVSRPPGENGRRACRFRAPYHLAAPPWWWPTSDCTCFLPRAIFP